MENVSPKVSDNSEEKKKLFCWFVQWLSRDDKTEPIEFDLPELTIIMQLLGFKLQTFEKLDTVNGSENPVSVELTCGKSGMRSTLTKGNSTCKCPLDEEVSKSQFWTVTACVPSSQENINSSTSSLLPKISKAKSRAITTLLSGALFVINSAATDATSQDTLPNIPENSSPFRRSFSLDTFRTSALNQKGLKRQHSWEVDPKTSPPTQTSSPLPSLCASMSQVSLSSENHNSLMQNLKSIQKLVKESLEINSSGKNTTLTKVKYKRVSDIKPAEEVKERDTPEMKFVTPRRMVTPKKYRQLSDKKNVPAAVQNSKMATLQNKVVLTSRASPAMKEKTRVDTPMPGTSRTPASHYNVEKAAKSKIASYVGLTPKSIYRVSKTSENEANSSNSSTRFKNVVKATSTGASYKPK